MSITGSTSYNTNNKCRKANCLEWFEYENNSVEKQCDHKKNSKK